MSAKILRVNKRKEEAKMVGVYMPLWVNSYIALYTTAKGSTKAHILRTLIENWVVQQREKIPDEELVSEIRKRVIREWTISKTTMSVSTFKGMIKEELEKTDIVPSIVMEILNDVK